MINLWMPEKIEGKWDYNDPQQSVNRLHINFPKYEKNETDPIKRSQLTRYNDIIHELESLFSSKDILYPRMMLCFDDREAVNLEPEDYKLFTIRRTFGELCLHYPHVGRHPLELYYANDIDCPVDQIVPQSIITADHTLRFYEETMLDHYHLPKLKEFYNKSTLRHIMDFKNPKMAYGYISLGKLVSTLSLQEVLNQVKSCYRIINWRVY
jgi:hypothetical protein